MFLDKSIHKFKVLISNSSAEVLNKYKIEKARILVVVDDENHLKGVITNGDILSWFLENGNVESSNLEGLYNKNCTSIKEDASPGEFSHLLKTYNYIPVIDGEGKFIAMAQRGSRNTFQIGSFKISEKSKTFVIAEIGINHNGSMEIACKLIDDAVEAGCDAVKVQVRDFGSLYTQSILNDSLKAEHGTQYLLSELKKSELPNDAFITLQNYARQAGILFLATPFDLNSVDLLKDMDVPAIKIGSPDFTNLPLLEKVVTLGKPMIVSTGMSTEHEIHRVIDKLNSWGVEYCLLHCNSTYPASIVDLNLKYIQKLQSISQRVVGYSGHERGYLPTLSAVALGAKIIERHLTFDPDAEGPDHSSSLEVNEFKAMIADIRMVEASLGQEARVLNQGEQVNRIALGKSLVLVRDLKQGDILNKEDLMAKTPARGVSPMELDKFVGCTLSRDMNQDDYIQFEDVAPLLNEPKSFDINKKWGIVGRLNDFEEFLSWKPKLIEIHLTWRDLVECNLTSLKTRFSEYDQELVVHAPEYYQDKLIDFATSDPSVLEYSIEMLSKTIELAKMLGAKFSGVCQQRGPKVVVHPGGHFESLIETNKADQYKKLKNNLKSLDTDGVELLIENMPPNPWYFGGQWYNSIFMDSQEIKQFSEETKFGVCYDTSHALLYCNSVNLKLNTFTKNMSKFTRHLHIADGAGTTQEGLQLGDGCIDFEHLYQIIGSIDAGFIPEIWQGHLNNGKGFHQALGKIERLMKQKLSTAGCSSKHQ
jgi:sialic acid synthase SpsE/endonuclease IV